MISLHCFIVNSWMKPSAVFLFLYVSMCLMSRYVCKFVSHIVCSPCTVRHLTIDKRSDNCHYHTNRCMSLHVTLAESSTAAVLLAVSTVHHCSNRLLSLLEASPGARTHSPSNWWEEECKFSRFTTSWGGRNDLLEGGLLIRHICCVQVRPAASQVTGSGLTRQMQLTQGETQNRQSGRQHGKGNYIC